MPYIKHFGINVLEKSSGLKLTRENYVEKIVFKDSHVKKHYTDSVIKKHTEDYLYNYDRNMKYFRSLSKEKFNEELMNLVGENINFEEITDLIPYDVVNNYKRHLYKDHIRYTHMAA